MQPGFFVNVEGIDGTGKTSQLKLLVERFRAMGREVVVVKEPGDTLVTKDADGKEKKEYIGSEIGAQIRHMLFTDPTTHKLDGEVTDLLFLADHIQLWRRTIQPALREGKVVVSDRYADSQFAYGVAKGASAWTTSNYKQRFGPQPDATVLLLGDPTFLRPRTKRAGTTEEGKQDGKRWEGVTEQEIVRDAYLLQLAPLPRTITVQVTEGKDIPTIAEEIWTGVKAKYDAKFHPSPVPEQMELYPDGAKVVGA
jgi:dTMP kinase